MVFQGGLERIGSIGDSFIGHELGILCIALEEMEVKQK